MSRGPSSRGSLRGGGENPFDTKICIKRNFQAYVKKVVKDYLKDQEVVSYPNYTSVEFSYQAPKKVEIIEVYKPKKLVVIEVNSAMNPMILKLEKEITLLKRENKSLQSQLEA